MQENLLQFIWEQGYFNRQDLRTHLGDTIEILTPGQRNTHQGPDFLQARLRIGKTEWVGNVELHLQTSDWIRHGHQHDPRYQNLVLHVVWQHQGMAPGNIPVLELKGRVPGFLLDTYTTWMNRPSSIPCAGTIRGRITDLPKDWSRTLLTRKLELRAAAWLEELDKLRGHWEELCWQKIARNFGYRVNADAFEELARSIPLKVLGKHRHQVHQLEALLFGQAGMLYGNMDDPYPILLQKEYAYLKKMHGLRPIHCRMQFLRMRPGNFPSVRLAQLAMLVLQSKHLFVKMIQARDIMDLESLFDVTANDFWHYHYRFGKSSDYAPKTLGKGMVRNIILNTVCPLLFAYGKRSGETDSLQKAVHFLETCPAEEDHEIRLFMDAGLIPASAAESQAMHFLKREFCDAKRCLECVIGEGLLKGIRP
jgi:Protein of unknown function (DUF2851)